MIGKITIGCMSLIGFILDWLDYEMTVSYRKEINMTQKELVEMLRDHGAGIENFIYDADKESLRRLVLELDYTLYDVARELAREKFASFDDVKLEVYRELADNLEEAWTFGTGEWEEEDE